MIEHGRGLATWRLEQSPAGLPAGGEMPAVRIADHRLEYLEYEGPVSRGRGRVARLDIGACTIISAEDQRWEFHLDGGKIQGRFELTKLPGADEWRLRRLSDREQCAR